MENQDLEFLICQYLDGTLPVGERQKLEMRLSQDQPARELLESHRRLDEVLKSQKIPEIQWDALESRITMALDARELPATSYRLFRIGPAKVLAVAAGLMLAFGAFILMQGKGTGPMLSPPIARNPTPAQSVLAEVNGPEVEPASDDNPQGDVALEAPSHAVQDEFFSKAVAEHTPYVFIASAAPVDVSAPANPR
jgi:anti-sigma factor RsiW